MIPPRHCTWSHTSTVSRVTPSQALQLDSQFHSLQGDLLLTVPLGSHIHSLQGDSPPPTLKLGSQVHTFQGDCILQTRTWGHTSTDFMVNTLPTPCNWNHRSTVSRLTPYSRPCLWVHKSSLQGDPTTRILYPGSHVHCLQVTPLPDSEPGVTRPQSLG